MSDQPRSRMLWVLLGGGVLALFFIGIFALVYFSRRSQQDDGFSGFGDKIGVVDLQGVILSPKEVVEQLHKYGEDSSIKAIVLHVDSPGGGAAASEEIYREVLRIRDQKKKRIVASIETVGASGAYYVSAATNKIFADNASIVGSIGVIAEWVNYEELLKWAKLRTTTLKAGEFKDTGSPTRQMTPQERAYMQGLIDDMHTQFIHSVAAGRSMKESDVRALANGKVWTGEQALPLKLVDQVGDFRAAIDDTAQAVGITGEPTLVHPEKHRKSLFEILSGDASDLWPNPGQALQTNIGFYYLWKWTPL
jgi:protease-4